MRLIFKNKKNKQKKQREKNKKKIQLTKIIIFPF